jgi:hypothetical protein
MSTNYTSENPRRSRGGRSRSRRSGGNDRSGDQGSRKSSGNSGNSSQRGRRSEGPSTPRPPKKLTFWQKIVAFFTGGEKSAPARVSTPARKTESSSPAAQPAAERAPRTPRSGMRKPESVEVTTPRLYVGNLSFDAAESDLFELFNGVGIVQNVEVVSNRQTQRSKGFAFVQMQTVDEAKRAVSELHDKEYMGRKLVVSGAKAADRRDDREEREERPQASAEPTEQPEQQQQQPEQ